MFNILVILFNNIEYNYIFMLPSLSHDDDIYER
jgi:hypothetical protein